MPREVLQILALSLAHFILIRGYCNNDVVNTGKVLRDSVFKYNSHPDTYSCAASCLMHTMCKSFNFHVYDKLCFLNYNTSADINNFEVAVSFIQSDIDGWAKEIAGPCKDNTCSANEECAVDRLGRKSCKALKMMHVEYDNETEYTLMNTRFNWTEAKSVCENLGGHLAIIEDERENEFIKSMMTEIGFATSLIWIGATDEVVEDSWFWVDGQAIVYTAWMTGQPNNPGNQDCAGIVSASGWKSNPCSYTYRFLCETKV